MSDHWNPTRDQTAGLEAMRRMALELSALKERVNNLEQWTSRWEGPTAGNAADVLRNNGDGTASWSP